MIDAASTNPLHADYYADRAVWQAVDVVENERIAESTYRMRIATPDIARTITPGQFLMVRIAGLVDPMLGRAFALFDVAGEAVDFVYIVHGKMTTALASLKPGAQIEVWGPLGNGFAPTPTGALIMIAGGVGVTPMMALGKAALGKATYGEPPQSGGYASRAMLCYGVRSAEYVAGEDAFREAGIDLRLASDDGSVGHRGLVTELLERTLDETVGKESSGSARRVVCCGPEPMMEAVAEICHNASVACEASLETPMACGIGICFSCVAKVRQPDGQWDYKRTCVEGPVFDAEKIAW